MPKAALVDKPRTDDAPATARTDDANAAAAAAAFPFADFDAYPQDGIVYLYSGDADLSHGQGSAYLERGPAPLDPDKIASKYGGGSYRAIFKTAKGQIVTRVAFAIAGPSMLRRAIELADPDRADTGGTLLDRIERMADARNAAPTTSKPDARLDRIEKAVLALTDKQESSRGDRMMEMLCGLTMKMVEAQMTRAAEPPKPASSFVENLEAAMTIAEKLNDLRGGGDGDDLTGLLVKHLGPALAPALLSALQQRPAAPTVTTSAPMPQLNPAPPVAEAPVPELTPATPPERITLPPPELRRALAALDRLAEALATADDMTPDEWAAWAADTVTQGFLDELAASADPVGETARAIDMFVPELATMLRGPGRPYLEALVKHVKTEDVAEAIP